MCFSFWQFTVFLQWPHWEPTALLSTLQWIQIRKRVAVELSGVDHVVLVRHALRLRGRWRGFGWSDLNDMRCWVFDESRTSFICH